MTARLVSGLLDRLARVIVTVIHLAQDGKVWPR